MKHYEAISEYNDVIYDSSPVSVDDYLSDKYNIVHNELYNDALTKFLNSFLSTYVNPRLLYELFMMMNSYDNRNTMIDDIYNNEEGYIYKMLKNYELKKDVLYSLVELIDDFILKLKNYLIDNAEVSKLDINEQISEIISMTIYNISDFRLYVENLVLLISENDKELVESEIDINSFFFLLEDEDEKIMNIGFNDSGQIIITFPNDIYNYNNIDNEKIIKSILKKRNKSLMENIMNTLIIYYKKYHRIIEIKNTEYWMPSEIMILNNKMPYNKLRISLKDYWNLYQKHDEYDVSYIKLLKENNLLDSEVTNIDYVKGKVDVHARMEDLHYNVPFKYLNEKTILSDDITLKNTFTIGL